MVTARKSASKVKQQSHATSGAHESPETQPTASTPKTRKPAPTTPAKTAAKRATTRKTGGAAASGSHSPDTTGGKARGASPVAASIAGGAPEAPKLSPQQARFAAEYLKDFNGTKAAIRAGYKPEAAAQQASRLLKHVQIRAVIAPKVEQVEQARANEVRGIVLSAERTRLEIARLAYFDPRRMFAPDGRPLQITEMDDDTAAAIAGLDVLEEYEGSGEDRRLVGHVKKYKIADKNAALEKAAKIDGIYERDNAQKAGPAIDALTELLGALHQAGGSTMAVAAKRAKR